MGNSGRRWAWVAVLLVGVGLHLLVLETLAGTGTVTFVPALILLGASVAPATFLAFAQSRPGRRPVPGSVVGVAALLGGVIGVVAAGWLEYDALHRLGVLPMALVGLAEETAKLIVPAGILLLWHRHRHRSPAEGLVIGVASGAGFAALETMGYAFAAFVGSQGNLGEVEQTLLVRGLTAPAAHLAWTGLTAAALFAFAAAPGGRKLAAFLLTFAAAVTLHTCWDTFGTQPAYVFIGGVSLGWVLLRLHLDRERPPASGTPVVPASRETAAHPG
ncbi:PrsW family glutamic-type intramembrane protease [Micromonospora sp. WMMA1949]|uniref:PrsW family intramembrane metalloprotease n=1 Tax=Micromonospora sp. WMMA1949 TaxID=3015162 RepID=UPI0022B705F1|nr:PrsW family glutamic-type intramembrane protease [Micromonospora sp. WMMA1949]MCZ7429929.1 PrsW family glutamic-type intramembrane protease [Micromonospora sp. WMMA1949]